MFFCTTVGKRAHDSNTRTRSQIELYWGRPDASHVNTQAKVVASLQDLDEGVVV